MGIEAKIASGNMYSTNQPADYCSTDTIAQDNRSLHGNQSLNPSPTLKERRPHQESRQNLLSTSRQSFTTEAQCHSTEGQDWCDRSSRFGSSKSEGRPFRPRKQMDSVTEYEMSRSVPLHNKYFSHEVWSRHCGQKCNTSKDEGFKYKKQQQLIILIANAKLLKHLNNFFQKSKQGYYYSGLLSPFGLLQDIFWVW